MRFISIIIMLISFFLIQCKTAANLTKEDYYNTADTISTGDLKNAVKEFPDGEDGYFITTMEKTYLNLLLGKPEIEQLSKFARNKENRIRYKITREAKSLIYLAAPEGYYPSEHEIIWMHMLLSWGYSLKGDYEKARVEAKESSNLLQMKWSEEGRFDDALMRIILGTLWAMCGEWDEAQVDFRKASILDPSLKWAEKLGNREMPPENLIIILGGIGPEPFSKNKLSNDIRFHLRGKKSNLYIKDNSNKRIQILRTPDSSYWYKRHLKRYHSFHDIIKDTQYGSIVVSKTAKATFVTTGGVLAGVSLFAGGIIAGGAIIYYSIVGDLTFKATLGSIGVGLSVGGYGIIKGTEGINKSINYAERADISHDISRYYRYVRFLPEYAWVGWSNQELFYPLKVYRGKELIFEIGDTEGTLFKKNKVLLSYYSDSSTERILIKKYENIILDAVKNNKIITFKKIIGNEINSHIKTSDGRYLIHHVVNNNRIVMCKHILNLDSDINCRDSQGNTPLNDAINNQFYEMALLLIKNGADVNLRNYMQVSPLALAVSKEKSYTLVKELLSNGASVESIDNKGWKIIHYAALQNDARVVKLLIDRGVYLNSKTPEGETPLQIARNNNNSDVMKFLKKYGATD